ncbi:MAG: hypothetical protein ACF8R9_04205 [Phycisphaerales bacterium JB054]
MPLTAQVPCPEPNFLGYLFKHIVPRPGSWCLRPDGTPAATLVQRICSVSNCIRPEPETKHEQWGFNAAGCYDRPDSAFASVPPDRAHEFTALAWEFFPILFEHGVHQATTADMFFGDTLEDRPRPAGLIPLGYDVVSCLPASPATSTTAPAMAMFRCSPLSCNGEAANHPVNAHCLLDGWDHAVAAAEAFSRDEPESGPYAILRVNAIV